MFDCPNLAVPMEIMQHVVRVESSRNPYAIGVVGGRLVRQPRNLDEAVATAQMLHQRGYNFSLGIAQVNRYNLAKYGITSYRKAFEICLNLQAGTKILRECYNRSGGDWGKSFSCYYSGNFVTGFRHGYVQKVFASIRQGARAQKTGVVQIAGAIPLVSDNRSVSAAVGTARKVLPVIATDAGLAINNISAVPVQQQMLTEQTQVAPAVAPQMTRPSDDAFVF